MNEDTYRDKLNDLQLEVEELRAKLAAYQSTMGQLSDAAQSSKAGDLISRAAALTALTSTAGVGNRALDKIRALPSAHCDYCPYPDDYDGRVQVVRCKDCKYHGCNTCGHKLGLIAAFDNDFCSYAERRTDE